MSVKEIENLNGKLFDLEIKVKVLEKLYDQSLQALAKASVAEKTADKALAMAQEALVIVMKPDQNQSSPNFDFDEAPTLSQTVKVPVRANGPTDDELSAKLEEAENEFS